MWEIAPREVVQVQGKFSYQGYKETKENFCPVCLKQAHKYISKAFAVQEIIAERIWRDQIDFKSSEFQYILCLSLIKAGKVLPQRKLNLLIRNSNLTLKPFCGNRFYYQDCKKNHCLFCSKFSFGWVTIGTLRDLGQSHSLAYSPQQDIYSP